MASQHTKPEILANPLNGRFSNNVNLRLAFNQLYKKIFSQFHLDVNGDALERTPDRVLDSLFDAMSGYDEDPTKLLQVTFKSDYDEMVVIKGIPFTSLCEHHLMPFWGTVSIGYIPSNGRVAGLSKFPRVVQVLAKRLQIQENLTGQIAEVIEKTLQPVGAGVVIKAEHSCTKFRGACSDGEMITSSLSGVFKEGEPRQEFLSFIRD